MNIDNVLPNLKCGTQEELAQVESTVEQLSDDTMEDVSGGVPPKAPNTSFSANETFKGVPKL